MHPVLFKIGGITLYTYGLFVGLGFLVAVWLTNRRAATRGIAAEKISDLFFVVLVASILGARLFYVVLNLSEFTSDPLNIVKIWNGGLVFYGGFITALVTAMAWVKKQGLDLWNTADLLAPPIALGHAVGRLGCLFAGCCYGRECHLPWAIEFHNPDSLAPLGVYLHPTQVYSVLSNLSIFLILLMIDGKKGFKGRVFWSYILLYGLFRSFIEMFRGDFRGDFFLEILSVSQTIGIMMSVFAAFMLVRLSRQGIHDRN
ncbi:MAG: prolipoprotein diacylglyceryl transferase [Desulfobacteraceae bacterium]|nr:prolipoprotein diacylglyceryl transferase [Desulfobacteraceae bacterium]